jgi:putative lipoic acid-binding regulatory protein
MALDKNYFELETPQETLIEFPCDFPIKVMGETHPDFTSEINTILSNSVLLNDTLIESFP